MNNEISTAGESIQSASSEGVSYQGKVVQSLPSGSTTPVDHNPVTTQTAGVNVPLILGLVIILSGLGYELYKQLS